VSESLEVRGYQVTGNYRLPGYQVNRLPGEQVKTGYQVSRLKQVNRLPGEQVKTGEQVIAGYQVIG